MTTFNESQKAVVYASLILQDEKLPVKAENIMKILNAAGIKIEKIWAEIFERTFKNKDIDEFLCSANTCAQQPVQSSQVQQNESREIKKEEKKQEEEEEESDADMGFGLFD